MCGEGGKMEEFIKVPTDLAKEFVKWADKKSFCNSGQSICDRLANFFASYLEEQEETK